MTTWVNFFGMKGDHEVPKGTISWDGNRFDCSPNLKPILEEELHVPGEAAIKATADPIEFLKRLSLKYRSPYFWAEPAESSDE